MATAIVLGASGMVGAAVSSALLDGGWTVLGTGRSAARFPCKLLEGGARFVHSDRHAPSDVADVLSEGADAVVDCVGYTAAHARAVCAHASGLASVVFISSKAVYVDDDGRHSNSVDQPEFGAAIREDQSTMAPSDDPYDSPSGYGANKVAAELVYLESGLQVSVIRPSRIHGVGNKNAREWVFLKRALDGRSRLPLAHGGRGINHPTAAVNLAALVRVCAEQPGTRIVNSADPDAPDGKTIARVVGTAAGHVWDEVLLGDDAPAGLGDHPWNSVPPVVLDTDASLRLGYQPIGTYAETVRPAVEWLMSDACSGDPEKVLPPREQFARYLDYQREDALLAL